MESLVLKNHVIKLNSEIALFFLKKRKRESHSNRLEKGPGYLSQHDEAASL
jgi:hypothetical protein